MQVRSLNSARVFGDLTTGWCLTVEPAVLIELGDVVDENVANRQLTGQHPQPVGPEVVPTPGDEMGMMFAIHVRRLKERLAHPLEKDLRLPTRASLGGIVAGH